MKKDGYIRNCFIDARPGDQDLSALGQGIVRLDGYAIIPIETFHFLNRANGFAPENHWPCSACGAERPTAEGHDPCIANLPGVSYACCGHGYGHAYVTFSDGRIMRGHFEKCGRAALAEEVKP